MPTAIEFENISKQYRLGLVSTRTLSHDLKRWYAMNIQGKDDPYLKIGEVNDRAHRGESEYVWALKDINFKVEQGDVLGIIGKNGAGKSTLLKILSKVTAPTTGTIKARGRIASLLEVGTGFHPEMTGRENIYLNGAILGMTKAEITRKLDEIVDFSGVERYIDTPVKRYSSGMMVRLGFAVAAHLDPEILVVDEVLAVGDAEFQKKAIGKMQDISKGGQGRTVLFVSHNMTAVKSLCKTGIVMQNGMVSNTGNIDEIVAKYMRGDSSIDNYKSFIKPITGDGFRLNSIGIRKKEGMYSELMRIDQDLELIMNFDLDKRFENFFIEFHFKNEHGQGVFAVNSKKDICFEKTGNQNLVIEIQSSFFNWGIFYVSIFVVKDKKEWVIYEPDIITFQLSNKELEIGEWMGKSPGDVTPRFKWKLD